jgi:hypothetical protein
MNIYFSDIMKKNIVYISVLSSLFGSGIGMEGDAEYVSPPSPLKRSRSLSDDVEDVVSVLSTAKTSRKSLTKRPRTERIADSPKPIGDIPSAGEAAIMALSQSLSVAPRDAAMIQLLNASLYVPIADNDRDIISKLSPTKIDFLRSSGVQSPEIKEKIGHLRSMQPKHIQNLDEFPHSPTHPLTPAARVVLPRKIINKAVVRGDLFSLPTSAFDLPVPEESLEEIEARKEAREKAFLEAENKKNKAPTDLTGELLKEYEKWEIYFEFITARKTACVEQEESPLFRSEIKEAFQKWVAPHLKFITKDKYTIYYDPNTLDLKRTDIDGATNLKRMRLGLCPIGADGESMNHHHLLQVDSATHDVDSIIVLITDTLHTKYSGKLHFSRKTYQGLPRLAVDRGLFQKEREEFNIALAKHLQS